MKTPHSVETEQAVLGAIIIDIDAFSQAHAILTDADFYRENHRDIFKAARKLHNAKVPIDLVTVSKELERTGKNSDGYLADIASQIPTSANVKYHAKILKELSIKRQIQRTCLEAAQKINGADEADKEITALIEDLSKLRGNGAVESKDIISSLPTLSEIASLDLHVEYLLEGLIPQDSITILYGKGGRGKSTIMMQIGYCISKGIPFEGLATKKAKVVYIDFDNPLNVIADKARNFEDADNFHYWHITNTKIKPSRMDKQEWAVFKSLPKGSLLIFDTLKSCQGLDMDRDNTMAFVMGRFRELRDEGFTIVVLHHGNRRDLIKNNTTITDNADHVLALKPLKHRDTQTPDEQQEEPEYVRDLFFGCGVEDKSRYPKKHIYLSFDGQIFELIQDPEAESYNMIRQIMLELAQDGNLPNQSRIVSEANQQLKLHRNKTLEILGRGEGRYWKSKRLKDQKNQKVYEPVVLLSTPIYRKTTEQLPEKHNHLSGQHPPINHMQALDNIELSSCCKDSLTTGTTEVIEVLEVVE